MGLWLLHYGGGGGDYLRGRRGRPCSLPRQSRLTTQPPPSSLRQKYRRPGGMYLKGLSQKSKDFVDNCTNNISQPCAQEIVKSLFNYKNITTNCCHELVKSGLECHTTLVKLLVRLPQFKEKSNLILANSIRVFGTCVDTVMKLILNQTII